MDLVERFVPADLLEPARATWPRAPQRPVQPAGAVCELGAVTRYLVADDPFRVRQRLRAAHLYDAVPLDLHGEAAGVRTIEGTNTGMFQDRHDRLQNEVGHSVGTGGSAKEPIFACRSDRSVGTAHAYWSGAGAGFMARALLEHESQTEAWPLRRLKNLSSLELAVFQRGFRGA